MAGTIIYIKCLCNPWCCSPCRSPSLEISVRVPARKGRISFVTLLRRWHREERSEPAPALQEETQAASPEEPQAEGSTTASSSSDSSGAQAVPGDSGYTTVMLRNIPNKYTREMLVKQLNQDFKSRFDFVYLPIDFKNKCNVGYGFINFRTSAACDEFIAKYDGVDVRKCLPGLNSKKVAGVTPARVQGLEENVRRLRTGPVMNELVNHPEWMPLLLDENGE
ncbi:ML4, partial [Symbiodinium necroappetens]